MPLYLDIGVDDLVRVGERLEISFVRKSGQRARLRFDGSEKVEMIRRGREQVNVQPALEVDDDHS